MSITDTLDPNALYWASFNRFEMRLSGMCVSECCHSGDCSADCEAWVPLVQAQVEKDGFANRPTAEKIREELREYGAWDEEQLADDEANWVRLIWCAASHIFDEAHPDCSEPVRR